MTKLTSWLCFWLVLFACETGRISADTVTLNSGERVEGKIIEETPEQVSVEFLISAGVYDQRTVPRSEIKSIEKEPPDEAEFHALKNLKPGPNWLREDEHDPAIAQLKSFIQRYPLSANVAQAKITLDEFEKERKRVAGGDVKYHSEWLTSEQAEKQRGEIQGEAFYEVMKELSARGDLVGAMNLFDALEKQTPGARVFPDAVDLAVRVLTALQPDIDRRILTLKAEQDNLAKEFKTMPEQQRIEVNAALQREYARLEAGLAAAEKAKIKWVPLQPRYLKSLEKLKAAIQNEKSRLAALPVTKMRESIQLANTAANELSASDIAGAENDLKTALAAWPQNILALRIGKEIEKRKADAAIKIAAAKASPSPSPSPKPTPKITQKPLPTPTPAPKRSWFSFGAVIIIIGVIAILAGAAAAYNRTRASNGGQS